MKDLNLEITDYMIEILRNNSIEFYIDGASEKYFVPKEIENTEYDEINNKFYELVSLHRELKKLMLEKYFNNVTINYVDIGVIKYNVEIPLEELSLYSIKELVDTLERYEDICGNELRNMVLDILVACRDSELFVVELIEELMEGIRK